MIRAKLHNPIYPISNTPYIHQKNTPGEDFLGGYYLIFSTNFSKEESRDPGQLRICTARSPLLLAGNFSGRRDVAAVENG